MNDYMKKSRPLTTSLWCLYALIAFWPLRFYIATGSFISLGQLTVIMAAFLFLIFDRKFKFYRTVDDDLMMGFVVFITANCLIQNMIRYDPALKFIQWRSLLVSLLIIFPYFISRAVRLDICRRKFIRYLVFGMSLFIIYRTYGFIDYYLATGNKMAGRIMIAQRYPVVFNFIFLTALLYKTKNFFGRVFMMGIALLSVFLMFVSLTRAVYFSFAIDLIVLAFFRPRKTLLLVIIATLLLMTVSLRYVKGMEPLWQTKTRFAFTIESIKNPEVDSSATDRIAMWKGIIDINAVSPWAMLFGSGELGAGRFQKTVSGYDGDFEIGSAHSQYFDSFMRRGIVGLVIFLIINCRMVLVPFRLRKDKQYGWFYLAMGTGFLAMLPYNLFEESFRFMTFGIFFYAIYGMCVSEADLKRRGVS